MLTILSICGQLDNDGLRRDQLEASIDELPGFGKPREATIRKERLHSYCLGEFAMPRSGVVIALILFAASFLPGSRADELRYEFAPPSNFAVIDSAEYRVEGPITVLFDRQTHELSLGAIDAVIVGDGPHDGRRLDTILSSDLVVSASDALYHGAAFHPNIENSHFDFWFISDVVDLTQFLWLQGGHIGSPDGEDVFFDAFASTRAGLGDINLDAEVDDLDFALVRENLFTRGSGWLSGDFNFDGYVDVSDLNIVLEHRQLAEDRTQAVPEPTSNALLCALMMLVVLAIRWESRKRPHYDLRQ